MTSLFPKKPSEPSEHLEAFNEKHIKFARYCEEVEWINALPFSIETENDEDEEKTIYKFTCPHCYADSDASQDRDEAECDLYDKTNEYENSPNGNRFWYSLCRYCGNKLFHHGN